MKKFQPAASLANAWVLVNPPPTAPDEPADSAPSRGTPPSADADDATTARITLRLPDSLKARVEEAAARAGLSVNTWLVRALSAAVDGPGRADDDRRRGRWPGGQHFSGWVR